MLGIPVLGGGSEKGSMMISQEHMRSSNFAKWFLFFFQMGLTMMASRISIHALSLIFVPLFNVS